MSKPKLTKSCRAEEEDKKKLFGSNSKFIYSLYGVSYVFIYTYISQYRDAGLVR